MGGSRVSFWGKKIFGGEKKKKIFWGADFGETIPGIKF